MSKNFDHVKLNGRRLRQLYAQLNRAIRSARAAHYRAETVFVSDVYFHGGKMRNLDDLVMHLEDARQAIKEYLKP